MCGQMCPAVCRGIPAPTPVLAAPDRHIFVTRKVWITVFSLLITSMISDRALAESPTTPQACVRLPWQPNDKCKKQTPRVFATEKAKRDVASALEKGYQDFKKVLAEGKRCGKNPFETKCRDLDDRYQRTVMALGKLTDVYSLSVQPSKLSEFVVYYEAIKSCYPKCDFDWISWSNQ